MTPKRTALVVVIVVIVAAVFTVGLLSAPIPEPTPERAIMPTDTPVQEMEIVNLDHGAEYPISAGPVVHEVAGMRIEGAYAYNGSIPGPVLRVPVGSRITVPFTNNTQEPTTIHWHGLRHNIQFDGVVPVSQDPVMPGETFVYELTFPDEGVFWYHPHIREDRQQDLGLYGMILVEDRETGHVAADGDYDREEVLIINDLQPEVHPQTRERRLLPHGEDHPNMAMMGRFGSSVIVNGVDNYSLEAEAGEIVRFHILNAASARAYQVAFPGAPTRQVIKDLSAFEQPEEVASVLIGPAERYSVDVFFEEPGEVTILHDAPIGSRILGVVNVTEGDANPQRWANAAPRDRELVARARLSAARQREPDYVIDLDLQPDMDVHGLHMRSLGGPLYQIAIIDGIEWADDHLAHNAMTTSENWTWILREVNQQAENVEMELSATPGEDIIIRLTNRRDSLHPMHHPIHLHGQRFVILSRDRVPNENLVWQDTVTVRVGETVDLFVEIDQPGQWMLHCHIPEHMEAGMMGWLNVEGPEENSRVPVIGSHS